MGIGKSMHYKEKFLRFLLESQTLTFGEFPLENGGKAPYMINTGRCDTGVLLSRLSCFYARTIYEKMELGIIPYNTSILFGSSYKSIPLASSSAIALSAAFSRDIAYAFNIPAFNTREGYCPKKANYQNDGGLFVGMRPGPGDQILIIDDVVSSGTALHNAVGLLSAHAPEAKVIGAVVAVDRKESGHDARLSAVAETQYELGIPVFSIIDVDDIVEILKSGTLVENWPANGESDAMALRDLHWHEYEYKPITMPTPKQIAALEGYY